MIMDENEKIIFLLDTLDVIATDDGFTRLDDFLNKVKGEKRIIIGASRPLEFEKIEDLTTKSFALKPFSDDEIRCLFEKYKAFYKMEGVKLRPPVLEVCRNPLHMRMLFEVYQPNEIPEDINTQKLYDRYWDKKVAEIRIGALSHLDEGKKRRVKEVKGDLTKNIALEMLASKQVTLRKSNIQKIKDKIRGDYFKQHVEVKDSTDVTIRQKIKIEELTIAYLFDSIIDDACHDLLDEGVFRMQEDSAEFFHQSFFEYAAARSVIEEEGQSRQSLLEDLLLDITQLKNSAIIQQVILYAKRREKNETAYKFLKTLSETNLYTKILAIDLLKNIENITEKDAKIYQNLAKDEVDIRIDLAASLDEVIQKHPKLAIGLLETLSRDREVCVRKAAAHALPILVEVNLEHAIELIKTLGKDDSYIVQEAAWEALSKMKKISPEGATEMIETLIKDKDNQTKKRAKKAAAHALSTLVNVNPERAAILIKTLSSDEDYHVQRAAASALLSLVNVSPEGATELIETLIKDKDNRALKAAAEALLSLVKVSPERAAILIKTLSSNEDYHVRRAAANALLSLVNVSPEGATELIVTFGRDKDDRVLRAAAEALLSLVNVSPERATGLIETLSIDKDDRVLKAAAEALLSLVNVSPERAVGVIVTLSKNEHRDIREAAAQALSTMVKRSPERATGLIKTLSRSEHIDVREAAAQALLSLVEVSPKRAKGLIETLSRNEHSDVWVAVADALLYLAELYPQKARPLVERLLSDVEYIEIQKAIKEIVKKGLLKGKI
jgi:HEAT repeat protein